MFLELSRSSASPKALLDTSEDFLGKMEHTIHVGTALVSVITSILLGMWLPKPLGEISAAPCVFPECVARVPVSFWGSRG